MIPFNKNITIIAHDTNKLYAIHKPIGIKSIPNTDKIEKNAIILSRYDDKQRCYIYNDNEKFFVINRLDSPTSGVMLGCKNIELAKVIRQEFKAQKVTKNYIAITKFRKIPKEGIWKSGVTKLHNRNNVRLTQGTDLSAITKYKILQKITLDHEQFLLISLQPITGRTHQLRMHCAMNNIPILGDKTYGDFKWNTTIFKKFPTLKNRLYLHAHSITFSYNYNNKSFSFNAIDDSINDFNSFIA